MYFSLDRRKTRLESVLHSVSVCVSHRSLLPIIIPKSRCSATCSTFAPCSNRSSDKGKSWCFCFVAIVIECFFFGLMTLELLPHQHETWSKLSSQVCSTCIISSPDVWSVVSSASMSQATEIFVTCNGMSLVKMLNRIGPRTDPCDTSNFTEPSEEYEPWRKTRCVLPSRYDLKNGRELEFRRYHPSLYIMILWSTRSKAFFRSRNITPDASDLFIVVSQECVSRTKAVLQECLHQKPDWKGWMCSFGFVFLSK